MYNISQQQHIVSLSSSHHTNSSSSSALNFSMPTHHHSNYNTVNKHDRLVSPKKKKRKYNTISPTNPNTTYKVDSFLSTAQNSSSNKASQGSSMFRANSSLGRTVNVVDRVLDVNAYTKDTPLYTMCRDWIHATDTVSSDPSKQSSPSSSASKQANAKLVENSTFVTKLPDPVPLNSLQDNTDSDEYNVDIEQLNENIKTHIRSSEHTDLELIEKLNVDEVIQSHALLKLHVNRWKAARREWFNYYAVQNRPYENSYHALKSIFEDIV